MTRTHEVKLDGYGAHTTLAEDRPVMLLGTAESYGIEMLHIVPGKDWAELTITATFNASDGSSTDILMDTDGNVVVPSEATAKSGSGRIVFAGVSEGVQRISCDLEYFVVAHSGINGTQSGGVAPSWFEQAANRFMPPGGSIGQVLTKKTDADFDAEWQDSKGGGTTDHSKLENRDAADQHPISAITGLEEALTPLTGTTETLTPTQVCDAIKSGKSVLLQHTNSQFGLFTFASFNIFEEEKAVVSTSIAKETGGTYLVGSLAGNAIRNVWIFNVTKMAESDDIPVAVNEALAQAKASGEFDGADGQDGITPTIGDNGNWYLGETDTGKPSRGEKGDAGAKGEKGDKGDKGDTGAAGAAGADGKSAYAYAQDGGYTGTETEFAAKLAQKKFANPNALTFTGAVTGSYDGSEALTVNIPNGGESETWNVIADQTLTEDATIVEYNNLSLKKVMIDIFAVSSAATTINQNGFVSVNGNAFFYSNRITLINNTEKGWAQVYAECINDTLYHLSNTNNNNTYQSISIMKGWIDGIEKIEKITIAAPLLANIVIGAGTRIRVLGVSK